MTSITGSFRSALAQIESLLKDADDHDRYEISTELTKLARRSETPVSSLYRIGMSVNNNPGHEQESMVADWTIWLIAFQQVELCVVRTATELNLFDALSNAKGPLSVKELSSSLGCAELLLGLWCKFPAQVSNELNDA